MVVYKALQALRSETFEDCVIDQNINTDFLAVINDLMLILNNRFKDGDADSLPDCKTA